jgi:hypothetical protein
MTQSFDRGKRALWEALLRQFPSSGLSVRQFCRRRGVSEPSFYAWRRRLTGGGGSRGASRVPLFVPLRAAAPAGAAPPAARSPAGEAGADRIELLLGDPVGGTTVHTVRVYGQVPAERLASVPGVLREIHKRGEAGGCPC